MQRNTNRPVELKQLEQGIVLYLLTSMSHLPEAESGCLYAYKNSPPTIAMTTRTITTIRIVRTLLEDAANK